MRNLLLQFSSLTQGFFEFCSVLFDLMAGFFECAGIVFSCGLGCRDSLLGVCQLFQEFFPLGLGSCQLLLCFLVTSLSFA